MRDELILVLKEFLQNRLKEVKREKHLTQDAMANILQMERRTLAGVMRGEYSFGGLSIILFIVFLTSTSGYEIDILREKFLEVLKIWKSKLKIFCRIFEGNINAYR